MELERAKQLAEEHGYHFYWDKHLKLWACYKNDLTGEAAYFTRRLLEIIPEERFVRIYLGG